MNHGCNYYRCFLDTLNYSVAVDKPLSNVCVAEFGHNSAGKRKSFD